MASMDLNSVYGLLFYLLFMLVVHCIFFIDVTKDVLTKEHR